MTTLGALSCIFLWSSGLGLSTCGPTLDLRCGWAGQAEQACRGPTQLSCPILHQVVVSTVPNDQPSSVQPPQVGRWLSCHPDCPAHLHRTVFSTYSSSEPSFPCHSLPETLISDGKASWLSYPHETYPTVVHLKIWGRDLSFALHPWPGQRCHFMLTGTGNPW